MTVKATKNARKTIDDVFHGGAAFVTEHMVCIVGVAVSSVQEIIDDGIVG